MVLAYRHMLKFEGYTPRYNAWLSTDAELSHLVFSTEKMPHLTVKENRLDCHIIPDLPSIWWLESQQPTNQIMMCSS